MNARVRYRVSQTSIQNIFGNTVSIHLVELQTPTLDADEADRKFFEGLVRQPTIVDLSKLLAVPAVWVRMLSDLTIDNLDLVLVGGEPLTRMIQLLGQGKWLRVYATVEDAVQWWRDE